jgi:hypothetical protein
MGHTCHQRPQSFHFLGLLQLLLAFFKSLIVPPLPDFQLSELFFQLSHFKDELLSIFVIVAHHN